MGALIRIATFTECLLAGAVWIGFLTLAFWSPVRVREAATLSTSGGSCSSRLPEGKVQNATK